MAVTRLQVLEEELQEVTDIIPRLFVERDIATALNDLVLISENNKALSDWKKRGKAIEVLLSKERDKLSGAPIREDFVGDITIKVHA